ncbi:hypothetical protein NEOC95_001018 [Neochlamydia sp. AcF95]|nr:hypothetical protein [Neochlamydia sp. AcF95]
MKEIVELRGVFKSNFKLESSKVYMLFFSN